MYTSCRNFFGFNELSKVEESPEITDSRGSEIDQRNPILLREAGGETQQPVGDEAGNWSGGGGSHEVLFHHHLLEEWGHHVDDGGKDLKHSIAGAWMFVGKAIRDGSEPKAGVAGEGGGDGGVAEEAAVAEVGDDEGDVEVSQAEEMS